MFKALIYVNDLFLILILSAHDHIEDRKNKKCHRRRDDQSANIQLGKMGIIHGARTYVIQNEDGQIEEPYSISAGLDYPGIGPIHANLAAQRRANVLAINDDEAIEAAYELTKLEGIIPALESAHALGALRKLKFKPEDIVVLTVSGRGDKDIETYLSFNEQQ